MASVLLRADSEGSIRAFAISLLAAVTLLISAAANFDASCTVYRLMATNEIRHRTIYGAISLAFVHHTTDDHLNGLLSRFCRLPSIDVLIWSKDS